MELYDKNILTIPKVSDFYRKKQKRENQKKRFLRLFFKTFLLILLIALPIGVEYYLESSYLVSFFIIYIAYPAY